MEWRSGARRLEAGFRVHPNSPRHSVVRSAVHRFTVALPGFVPWFIVQGLNQVTRGPLHEPYAQPSSPLRGKWLFGPLVLVIQSPLAQLAIADRLKQLFAVDLLGRQF